MCAIKYIYKPKRATYIERVGRKDVGLRSSITYGWAFAGNIMAVGLLLVYGGGLFLFSRLHYAKARMVARYLKIIGLVLLSLLACDGNAQTLQNNSALCETRGPARMAKILTMDDNGREVSLIVGVVIRVELKVQGGTGYNWYLDELDESRLKLIDEETQNPSSRGAVGGPVLKTWSFKAVAPGDVALKLSYYRVWEGRERAAKEFKVNLHITGER